jgi:hypothetical protein
MRWLIGFMSVLLLIICTTRHHSRSKRDTEQASTPALYKVTCAKKFRYHSPRAFFDFAFEVRAPHRICRR